MFTEPINLKEILIGIEIGFGKAKDAMLCDVYQTSVCASVKKTEIFGLQCL